MRKITKNIIALFLIVLLVFLTACNNTANNTDKKNNILTVATGEYGETYYNIMEQISEIISDDINKKIEPKATDGSIQNLELIQSGNCDMAVVQNDIMNFIYNSEDVYENETEKQLFCALARLYDEKIFIVARKEIKSIQDLVGKTVSMGNEKSGTYINANHILNAYGINPDKDIHKCNLTVDEATESLRHGIIDAFFVVTKDPSKALTDLAKIYNYNLLPIDESHMHAILVKNPFYVSSSIIANTYKNVTKEVPCLSVSAVLVCRKDLPATLVEKMLDKLFEDRDKILINNKKVITLKSAMSGIGQVPLHDGAIKYYKKNNILN